MAQARVTEFYATKKRNVDAQPSKRRKLQTSSDVQDSRSKQSSALTPANSEPGNVLFTFSQSGSGTTPASVKNSKQRTRKIRQIKGQKTISDVLGARSASPTLIMKRSASEEEVTSAWDEHDGLLTPETRPRSRKKLQLRANESPDDEVYYFRDSCRAG
jgi:hypothetical protein